MSKELTLDLVQSLIKPNQKLTVGEETIAEVQKLAEDPAYGEEFLDCYLDHLNIFKENPRRSHTQYLHAVKFFSLVESGLNLTDAYITLFPERYEDRKKNYPAEERDKAIMRGEASRFNSSVLVNEIRKVATVPIQLIHRHTLHEAIIVQAELMNNARSEAVRQKASACLIEQLKPGEDHVLEVKVDDGTSSAIEDLRKATEALAVQQHNRVVAGMPVKEVSSAKLTAVEDPIDAEFEEVEEEPVDKPKTKWTMPDE